MSQRTRATAIPATKSVPPTTANTRQLASRARRPSVESQSVTAVTDAVATPQKRVSARSGSLARSLTLRATTTLASAKSNTSGHAAMAAKA